MFRATHRPSSGRIKFWCTVASCWGFHCESFITSTMHGSTNIKSLVPLNFSVVMQYLCWLLFQQQTSSVPYLQLEMLHIMLSTSQFQTTLPFASFQFAEGSEPNNHRNSPDSEADVCGTVFTDCFVAVAGAIVKWEWRGTADTCCNVVYIL